MARSGQQQASDSAVSPLMHKRDNRSSLVLTQKKMDSPARLSSDLFRTSTGRLWLATVKGLSEFSPDPLQGGGHFLNYTREHGLNEDGVRAIIEDRGGNLWCGTESSGAMKITRSGFTSYSESDGLEHTRIAALGEDCNGELFVEFVAGLFDFEPRVFRFAVVLQRDRDRLVQRQDVAGCAIVLGVGLVDHARGDQ